MSLRNIGRVLYRFSVEIALKAGIKNVKPTLLRISLKSLPKRAAYSRNLFLRIIQRTVRTQNLFRPLAALGFRHPYGGAGNVQAHNSRRWIRVRSKWQFLDQIKNIFATNERYNAALISDRLPSTLDGYEIGRFLDKGCNAAVYELREKQSASKDYPLACKIMFNYDFTLPERVLWHEMGAEIIPLASNFPPDLLKGKMGTFRPLSRTHPNIVKMYTAFVDRMPIIEGSDALYPEALPGADMFGELVNEPKTLFIVMKRYRLTLREYVLTHKRNYWTGRIMFGQLLEAIVFLHEQQVAHRDMKSDNILLDFDDENDIPHLVLSDFGSAQTSFNLEFTDEFIDLGGNLSLRAPEIRRAKLGTILDYSLADLWSAATMGYEIFTRINPFYSELNSATYTQEDLPELPKRLHYAVKSMIYQTLRINPEDRPLPHVAANVVCMSLFRFGAELKSILDECGINLELSTTNFKHAVSKILNDVNKHLNNKLDHVIGLYAAETISARLIAPTIISKSELQLRATFLSRLNRDHIWTAMEFFADDSNCENRSNVASSSSTGEFLSPILAN